ncbi:MAG: EVE domain-containing protein [Sphingomonas sanxanigenens]|uniref:EVE domain-containing protein n=1 Tax=Sphingomonas sanxanigenens TaxID=397260 RepID=A0A2W5A8H2_9SPHN|nr:MAG: EVE domain-containing protein [Sphingomonas sanxanigenens]
MAHWLVKSEPFKYSFDDLIRDGETTWDGVRNNQAAIYLRSMKLGEEIFFYHSNEGLAVVGIARIVKEHYIDPTDPKGRFPAVSVAPVRKVAHPVTLAAMKAEPKLEGMAMFRQFRLSVTPIADDEWATILGMAGEGT